MLELPQIRPGLDDFFDGFCEMGGFYPEGFFQRVYGQTKV
jgi:hypothetical protein